MTVDLPRADAAVVTHIVIGCAVPPWLRASSDAGPSETKRHAVGAGTLTLFPEESIK